jgi:inositol hexakisphosphate/diphosphoinositol-pentakisphosphate kinase
VVDGRVLRDADGKELRCPISLTLDEKRIARQVNSAFGQRVCGFDLLRTRDRSYVCDVNGFSFVKRAPKYYEDASQIIHRLIVRQLSPTSPVSLFLCV